MIKNRKLRTTLTSVITLVTVVCIALLYVSAQSGMTTLMKKSALENMKASLNAQTTLIEEYVDHQEDLLEEYSINPIVADYLKELSNEGKQKAAQEYTETYFECLDNWKDFM